MKFRRTLLGLAVAATALGFSTGAMAQAAYKPEYKMSLVLGPPTPWGMAGKIWSDLVKERTQGRINIKLYPGVSLIQGDQTREFSALRQGVIDMAVGSTINWSPQVKQLNLFSMPFLMPDYAAIDALTQGEVGKDIFSTVDKAGVVPLAWGENGYREVTNSKRAIKSPDDLKGMKIRVQQSPTTIKMIQALGASPTPMAWGEVYPALQAGVVDGAENNITALTTGRHGEVSKFFSQTEHQMVPDVLVISADKWASLKKPLQDALMAAAKESSVFQRGVWAEAEKTEAVAAEKLGVKISSPAKAPFVAKVKPMMDEERKNAKIATLLDQIEATR